MAKATTPETFDVAITAGKLPKPKLTHVDVDKLKIHPLNFRFDGTNNDLKLSTTQVTELADQIRHDVGIRKALTVLKDKQGQLWTLVGGRRTRAGQQLKADPQSSQELVKNLSAVEANMYEDLTDDQILFIVNDQDQKEFRYAEIVELILMLFGMGLSWKQVAVRVYRQWARLKGQANILNEVDTITDPKQREARIGKWLRGSIDEIFGEAFRIGPMCLKQLRLEAAEKDKLINTKNNTPKDFPKDQIVAGPEVYLTQDRLDKLRQAKQLDVNANQWNGLVGGPEFDKVWNVFKMQDLGLNPDGTPMATDPKLKALTREKIKAIASSTAKSRLAIKMLDLCAGDVDVKWTDSDAEIAAFEAKQTIYLAYSKELSDKNPELYKLMYRIFNDTNVDNFKEIVQTLTK